MAPAKHNADISPSEKPAHATIFEKLLATLRRISSTAIRSNIGSFQFLRISGDGTMFTDINPENELSLL